MSFTAEQLQAVMIGMQENRVELLRKLLGYPVKQHDREGFRVWFLRSGACYQLFR